MEVFQVIDDKNNCFGLYSGGKFVYDRIPNTFGRTHCWSQHLLGHDVEYSYLFRYEDHISMQYCQKGFFQFKKNIPKILESLSC